MSLIKGKNQKGGFNGQRKAKGRYQVGARPTRGSALMDEVQFIRRKIFLKRQAVSLIKGEVWDLRAYLSCLVMRSLLKRFIIWCFCHAFLDLRTTQKLYNVFRLRAD